MCEVAWDGMPDDAWFPANDPSTWGDELEFGDGE